MLVACRLAGLSALEAYYGSLHAHAQSAGTEQIAEGGDGRCADSRRSDGEARALLKRVTKA